MSKNTKIFITVILPVSTFFILFILDKLFPKLFPGLTGSELGLTENAQAILLLASFAVAASILYQRLCRFSPGWIKAWIFGGLFGLMFVFLEEISYGQHYFNWDTPEYWKALNDQGETNLHNTSSWLDQKPRLLLEVGIVIGGILVPLLGRFRSQTLPERLKIILPDSALFITSLLAVLPRIYERIIAAFDLSDWHLFMRTSEVQELYFYYFTFLYFIFLRQHLSSSIPKQADTKRIIQE